MSSKLPVSSFRKDTRNFITPSKQLDENAKSPNPSVSSNNNKYAHIQSRVKTFWTPQEMQRKGLQKFFDRKGTSSASTSASNSTVTSPEPGPSVKKAMKNHRRRSLQYQFAEPDFLARLNEIRKGILDRSASENSEVPEESV